MELDEKGRGVVNERKETLRNEERRGECRVLLENEWRGRGIKTLSEDYRREKMKSTKEMRGECGEYKRRVARMVLKEGDMEGVSGKECEY